MKIFILLLADRPPFYCLSTLVDTPLSDALYDKPLIFTLVHFSGHSLAILDIYLSVLFQFVHFSGRPLSAALHDETLVLMLVHFSGHTAYCLHVYPNII